MFACIVEVYILVCVHGSVCFVVHDTRLYSELYTVSISGEDVCCSVAFVTLVGIM